MNGSVLNAGAGTGSSPSSSWTRPHPTGRSTPATARPRRPSSPCSCTTGTIHGSSWRPTRDVTERPRPSPCSCSSVGTSPIPQSSTRSSSERRSHPSSRTASMAAEPIWITEHEVVELLALPDAVDLVERAFRAEASGRVFGMTKTHVAWDDGQTLHAIGAVDRGRDLVATTTWAHTRGGAPPLLIVWSARHGALVAVIEAFALGQLRTGAVSGVATRVLSRRDSSRLAVIGSGKQALAQVAAVAAVRTLEQIRVFSRTPAHRDAFAEHVDELDLGCAVESADAVDLAVAEADIVTTVTRATSPLLYARMLAPGAHINAVGAVTAERRELADDIFARATVVAADSPPTARALAAELSAVRNIVPLSDVVAAGDRCTRGSDLSVFKAMGVGLADLALGSEVLTRADAVGYGRPIPHPQRATPHLKQPAHRKETQ